MNDFYPFFLLYSKRDTTESDIKQRREIVNKTTIFVDQPAVRAALEGKVLILDGLEKAETNILPLLNNLIENRDMNLEDGRFLLNPRRYDELRKSYSEEQLRDEFKLLRVSENFSVVALCLPHPKYKFAPVDPPLRSRLQSRVVEDPSIDSLQESLSHQFSKVEKRDVESVVIAGASINLIESGTENFRDLVSIPEEFPSFSGSEQMMRILSLFPNCKLRPSFNRVYPASALRINKQNQAKVVDNLLEKLLPSEKERLEYTFAKISGENLEEGTKEICFLDSLGKEKRVSVVCGKNKSFSFPDFVPTKQFEKILSEMMEDHASGRDIAVIGPKSSGKSVLVKQFASLLGYTSDTMTLFNEISTRDLFQRRITNEKGETSWEDSSLIRGAKEGNLVVLDNADRLEYGLLSALQRIVQDREAQLFDGSKLVDQKVYNQLSEKMGEEELKKRKVFPIHPAFRVVVIGDLPSPKKKNYITPEFSQMLSFHLIKNSSFDDTLNLLTNLVPNVRLEVIHQLLHFVNHLEKRKEKFSDISVGLSTRQLVRILRKIANEGEEELYDAIKQNCFYSLLPSRAKDIIEELLTKEASIPKKKSSKKSRRDSSRNEESVQSVQSEESEQRMHLIPKVLFYEIPEQMEIVEKLERDFKRGSNLL